MDKNENTDQIMKPISIDPDIILFENVVQSKTYIKQMQITNNLKFFLNISLKWTSSDKIDIKPREFRLGSQKTQTIDIIWRISKPFGEKSGIKMPIREFIFIKSDNFDQKINLVIQPEKVGAIPQKYFSNSSCEDDQEVHQEIDNEEFESIINEETKQYDSNPMTNIKSNWDCEDFNDGNTESMQYSEVRNSNQIPQADVSQLYPNNSKANLNSVIQTSQQTNAELVGVINELSTKCKTFEAELSDYRKQK